jgi:hypothetical protein
MGSRKKAKRQRNGERGNTLYVVAGFMFVMLGMGALAIDLASLYVARTQSQRAADSAALAGAKVFVETGCVTNGSCAGEEGLATTRATQAASQSLVEGQTVTVQSVNFLETPQNPQITVQIQSPNLHLYFAGALGVTSGPTVAATATAEAYNPSGAAGGAPIYCTSCARPWLIANCDQTLFSAPAGAYPPSNLCTATTPPETYLLNPGNNYSVANPGCVTGAGVVGETIDMKFLTADTLYGALDVDNGAGIYADYQTAITTCFTGATTCGTALPTYILPLGPALTAATSAGGEALMHVTATGQAVGQDYIDATVCPPQIHAGALNPFVVQGVLAQDSVIATSDSIVTAYIFDSPTATPLIPQTVTGTSQAVNIVGFAQIFVTYVDPNGGDVWGVILGVAGCGSNPGACTAAIQGPTTMPVRLITPGT